jgi:hypothetical protein
LATSNVIKLNDSLPAFRATLCGLAEQTRGLHALFTLAHTNPRNFAAYRRPPAGDVDAEQRHFEAMRAGWPGRATAESVYERADAALAGIHRHSLKSGAVLCACTLLENYRIVGALYLAANERDPATFQHRAGGASISQWIHAVRETEVEFPRVIAALTRRASPARAAAMRAAAHLPR